MPIMPRDEAIAFNAEVVKEFRANEGRVGGILNGSLVILVHHVGVKTLLARITPLTCFSMPDHRRYLVVGSNGGSPVEPAWCANLRRLSSTTVELGAEIFTVDVEELGVDALERVWAQMFPDSPSPRDFQDKTGRRLPAFLLTRTQ